MRTSVQLCRQEEKNHFCFLEMPQNIWYSERPEDIQKTAKPGRKQALPKSEPFFALKYPCHRSFDTGQFIRTNLEEQNTACCRPLPRYTAPAQPGWWGTASLLSRCKSPLQTKLELPGHPVHFIPAKMTGLFILGPDAFLVPLLLKRHHPPGLITNMN